MHKTGYFYKIHKELKPFSFDWLDGIWRWVVTQEYGSYAARGNFVFETLNYTYHDSERQAWIAAYFMSMDTAAYYYIYPNCDGRTEQERKDIKLLLNWVKKNPKSQYLPNIEFLKFIEENNLTNKSMDDNIILYRLSKED